MTPAWSPGQRYAYCQWSPHERTSEGRVRARERGRIARMRNYELAAFLEDQGDLVGISWCARVSYRAARHEAVTVRGWPPDGNPKL